MATREQLEALISAAIRHQVALERYSNGQVRRILAILNAADAEIFAALAAALERIAPGQVEYLESLLGSVRALSGQAYSKIEQALTTSMQALAGTETQFQFELYRGALPITVNLAAVSAEQAYAATFARPFMSGLLKEIIPDLDRARMKVIRDRTRMGYLAGKTSSQIVREIRGTLTKGFAEGFVQPSRRDLETTVRSALAHTANTSRQRFFEANEDILEKQVWLSTLDSHTSEICIARAGKRYSLGDRPKPVGHQVPWCTNFGCGPGSAHPNCRSVALALLRGQEQFFGQRASGDGPVDANIGFGIWLKTQPAYVQDELLGPVRGQMFRDGKETVDKFFNDKGKWLTLDELKEANSRHARR